MANQYSQSGSVNQYLAPDLLNKAIDEIFRLRDQLDNTLVLGPLFHKVPMSSGLSYQVSTVGSGLDMPVVNQDEEAYPMVTGHPGYKKTFVVVNQRSAIRVTDTALKADRHDQILWMITGQMKSAMRKDEYVRASFLNNAFTSGAGADSEYLYSDSHPQEGGADAGTWDNLGTGTLTGPNLHTMRVLMFNMDDSKGYPDPVIPKGAVFNQALEQKWLELTTATKKPEGMLNEQNVLINGLPGKVSPYLTSLTAWHMIGGRNGDQMGLYEFVREDWNIKDDPSKIGPDLPIFKRIRSMKTFGFTTVRNMFGSTGA